MKKIILILSVLFLLPNAARAEKFCLISDIHNGKGTRKVSGENIIYPKYGNKYFKKALKRAKANNVDACIALGDNTNKGKKKEAKKLAGSAKKSGIRVIWVKGNHDKSKSQEYLYPETNYTVDFDDVRVVVLESNTNNMSGNGEVSAENIKFYNQAVQTNKKIVLAMHHPPFDKNTHVWNPEYDWIGNKPSYVLGGHFHTGFRSGKYISVKALTLRKSLEMEYLEL